VRGWQVATRTMSIGCPQPRPPLSSPAEIPQRRRRGPYPPGQHPGAKECTPRNKSRDGPNQGAKNCINSECCPQGVPSCKAPCAAEEVHTHQGRIQGARGESAPRSKTRGVPMAHARLPSRGGPALRGSGTAHLQTSKPGGARQEDRETGRTQRVGATKKGGPRRMWGPGATHTSEAPSGQDELVASCHALGSLWLQNRGGGRRDRESRIRYVVTATTDGMRYEV